MRKYLWLIIIFLTCVMLSSNVYANLVLEPSLESAVEKSNVEKDSKYGKQVNQFSNVTISLIGCYSSPSGSVSCNLEIVNNGKNIRFQEYTTNGHIIDNRDNIISGGYSRLPNELKSNEIKEIQYKFSERSKKVTMLKSFQFNIESWDNQKFKLIFKNIPISRID